MNFVNFSRSYLPATRPYFHFLTIRTFSKYKLIFTKIGLIDIVDICFGTANERIWSIFDRAVCPQSYLFIFYFQDNNFSFFVFFCFVLFFLFFFCLFFFVVVVFVNFRWLTVNFSLANFVNF